MAEAALYRAADLPLYPPLYPRLIRRLSPYARRRLPLTAPAYGAGDGSCPR